MTAEIAKIIDDGLRWYEEELWHDRPPATTVCIFFLLLYDEFHHFSNLLCTHLE